MVSRSGGGGDRVYGKLKIVSDARVVEVSL